MQSDTPSATTTTSTRVVNPLRSTISRRRTADRMSVDMDDISNASNSMTGESARSVAPRSDGGDGGEDSGEDSEGNRDNCTRRHTDESKWHTHEDEESGKTYYEHRLSGKVVWDIPGVNTDADAGSSVGVDNVYEGGPASRKDHGEVGVELEGEPWSTIYDEVSGHWYHQTR